MIQAWLQEEQFSIEQYDAQALLAAFQEEMRAGRAGEPSSLPMLPSYIGPVEQITPQTVAFIDAGGTHLRIGLATFNAQAEIQLHEVSEQAMPGARNRSQPPNSMRSLWIVWRSFPIDLSASVSVFPIRRKSHPTEMDGCSSGLKRLRYPNS